MTTVEFIQKYIDFYKAKAAKESNQYMKYYFMGKRDIAKEFLEAAENGLLNPEIFNR